MNISDALEQQIANILDFCNIKYVHESENNGSNLDFYLPDHNIYIEVKRYHSDRSNKQLSGKDNIILIQGMESINFLKKLLGYEEK